MPLYEYRCRNCNHQFEIQQAFSDDALTVCPECEGALRKVFNPVGISFKGSGFYKNDSRGSSSSSSSSSSTSGAAASSDDSSGGSKDKESSSSSGNDSSSSGGGSKEAASSPAGSGSGSSD